MNKPKIQVILGSIREGRNGEKVANWFMKAVKDLEEVDIELVDLKDYPLPLLDDEITPTGRGEDKHPKPEVQKWLDKISEADGYIFITPEYDHSVPGTFKNAVDYGNKFEWGEKPIGFVGYGAAGGGSRAIEHWRQIIAEIGMYDIREQILIINVWAAFNEQGDLLEHSDGQIETARTMTQKVGALAQKLAA